MAENGKYTSKSGRRVTPVDPAIASRVLDLYIEKRSTSAIAREVNLSQYKVATVLRDAGIPMRQRGMVDEFTRVCAMCWEAKNLSEFAKNRAIAGGVNSYCRICWASKNNEGYFIRAYGITHERYAIMLADQGGGCAICGGNNGGRRLHIDHCHDSGHVRGLLCVHCNQGLGLFKDNKISLGRAIEYLELHSSPTHQMKQKVTID